MTDPDRTRRAKAAWGDPPPHEPAPPPPPRSIYVIAWGILFIIITALGVIAGFAFGDVPVYVPGPGYDVCTTEGC